MATENTNSNVDPRATFFAGFAKGLQETANGARELLQGRCHTAANLVMLYAASDGMGRGTLQRHAMGVHSDPKEAKGSYASGWMYFDTIAREGMAAAKIKVPEDINIIAHRAPSKAKDDTMGSEKRTLLNLDVTPRAASIKFATSILVAFIEAGIDWSNVKLGSQGKMIRTTIANARRLFGDKKKASLDALELDDTEYMSIRGDMGAFKFVYLETLGYEWLKTANIIKPKERKTADIQARRDALANVIGIKDDDAASYDAVPSENKALEAFVSIANALNDGTLSKFRFDNVNFTVLDWITEGAKADAEGKPASAQYKALRQFVSNMLDKNIPADKKAA